MQITFPVTKLNGPSGVLPNGYILVYLKDDYKSPAGELCGKIPVRIQYASNGFPITTFLFWQNSDLSPAGSVYVYEVYSQDGQLVTDPIEVTL